MGSSSDFRATSAFREGVSRVNGAPLMLLGMFLATCLVALPLAVVLEGMIAGHLGGSLAATRIQDPIFASLLRESLLIGGWVAMWRPMEILLYDWWGLRNERRIHERLSRVSVQVVHTGARREPALSRTLQ